MSSDVVAQQVRFRMERQRAVLGTEPAPSATSIMSESALRFGPDDIMGPQLEHLRSVSERENVNVLVLPVSARTYPRRGAFALLDFLDEEDPSLAYVEVPTGAQYFDREKERADYEFTFGLIEGKSVPIKEWEP